jgi:pimeloyl-ACP methyl ester carboxylesterase
MWSIPVGPPVVTVFFQGLLNTQIGAARYTDELLTTTGELIRYANALPYLYRVHIGKELDEVKLSDEWGFQTFYNWLYNWYYGYAFVRQAPDAAPTLRWHATRLNHSNLGQAEDMIEHAQKVALAPPDADLVLFGFSRGATATFCALAHYRYARVRLVILESIVASVPENERWLAPLDALRFGQLVQVLAAAHDPHGASPASMVAQFPHVPVALIGCKNDPTVHIDGQRHLARQLAARGHEVYLLVLQGDSHCCALSPIAEDRRQYLVFVHALYRQLGLPHIEPLAEQGAPLLALTRVERPALDQLAPQ